MNKVTAKKSLGQNFLHDKNIIEKIVTCNPITEKDLIIEIGPGMGALTKELKRYNSQIICYEIDERMRPILSELEDEKLQVIYGDFLKMDIIHDLKSKNYTNLYVIGNLPYYITSPILEYLINSETSIKEMVFMVQKEVADRFSAKPKSRDYGYMTLFLDYYYTVTEEIYVPRTDFNPMPKVDSAVIKLVKKELYRLEDPKIYFDFLKSAFHLKRKTLKNNLASYDWNQIKLVLEKYNLQESIRAEEISQDIFIELYQSIKK